MHTSERKPRPFAYIVSILFSLLLLLSLIACSAFGNSEAPDPPQSTERPTESTHAEETGAENVSEPDRTLSYYVALIEELQDEIAALKAENFILSTLLEEAEKTDTEASVTLPFTYREDDGEITILSYTGSGGDVTIPEQIGGLPVTEIGDGAFRDSAVTSVTLPLTVEEIGWFAFAGCSQLTALTAFEGLTEVGYGAFDGCPTSLTITAPRGSYIEKCAKSYGIAGRNP